MSAPQTNEDVLDSLRGEYVQVLLEAIKFFVMQGRVPTASQLRSRLDQITNGGFDPKQIGFSRFRDFLEYAEAADQITVDHARVGDVTVSLPGIPHSGNASSPVIRRDVWDAFLRWKSDIVRYYDREDDCVRNVPTEVAPLEPEHLTQIRRALDDKSGRYIAVGTIDRETQIAWMHRFAQDVPDREVKGALLIALASLNPAGEFVTALKEYPSELRRWYSYLANHVEESITGWMKDNGLSLNIWVENSRRPDSPNELIANAGPDGRSHHVEKSGRGHNRVDVESRVRLRSVDELRNILHAAIDRMPVEQLRQLSIPLGYLIDL